MDVSFQSCLALLAAATAIARTCEQVALLRRRLAFAQGGHPSLPASKLAPAASAATLAYGYAIDADATLLFVAWLNTSAGILACVVMRGGAHRDTPAEVVDTEGQGNV